MSSQIATPELGDAAAEEAPSTAVPSAAATIWRAAAVDPGLRRRGSAPFSVLGRTVAKAWNDRVLGLSAEAAFWQLLSLPPLLLAVVGSLGYFFGAGAISDTEDRLIEWLSSIVTTDVIDSLVLPTVDEVLNRGRLDLISIGFAISLWAGSSAMATFVNTIVIAYDQRDGRGPIRSRLLALWLFIVFGLTSVVTLPLLLLGPGQMLSWFPEYPATVDFLITRVYPLLVCVLIVVMLASLYHVVLPRRLPWRRHVPGAIFAMVVFVLGAWGLRIYVAYFFATTVPYAALAAPIAALLFFYLLGLSILLGAELNAAIQARWPAPPRRIDRRRSARRVIEAEAAEQYRARPRSRADRLVHSLRSWA